MTQQLSFGRSLAGEVSPAEISDLESWLLVYFTVYSWVISDQVVNAKTSRNNSALDILVNQREYFPKITSLLIENGIDVNAKKDD